MLEFEALSNLPDLTVKEFTSIMHEKIHYRRKRVNQLRSQGHTNQEIAVEIKCKLSTVEKDLHEIRELSRQWYEKDSVTNYCESLHDGIVLYDNLMGELQILNSEPLPIDQKLQILHMISEYEIKKINLYRETIAVQNYLRRNKQ